MPRFNVEMCSLIMRHDHYAAQRGDRGWRFWLLDVCVDCVERAVRCSRVDPFRKDRK